MESIGEFFKQVRETKGLTIDEVASKTRIRTDFVKALEDGNFASCPIKCLREALSGLCPIPSGSMKTMRSTDSAQSAERLLRQASRAERLKGRQAEEERKRQAITERPSRLRSARVLTLIFLLSREQSSLLVSSFRAQTSGSTPSGLLHRFQNPGRAAKSEAEAVPPAPKPNRASPLSYQLRRAKEIIVEPGDRPSTHASPVPEWAASDSFVVGSGRAAGRDLSLGSVWSNEGQWRWTLRDTELSWVRVQIRCGSPKRPCLRLEKRPDGKARTSLS